jgi:hypothetical protein
MFTTHCSRETEKVTGNCSLVTVHKPHYRRTQEVYSILDASPPEETYDRLVEYVRVQTGKGCSRKLISKWKKTVNNEQLPVTSKLSKNRQEEQWTNNTNILSIVDKTSSDITLIESISEINQAEAEPIKKAKFVESQANLSIIGNQDKPEIAHQTSLPVEEEVTSNKRSLTNNGKNDSLLNNDNDLPPIRDNEKTGHWSLITGHCKAWSYVAATAIVVGLAGCGWFLSKDNSQPVIAQTTVITETAPAPRPQKLQPRTIKIDLTLTSPQDLKVKPGDEVTPGQVLSDRITERQRLLAQKKQLEISLKKLDLPIPEPTQPKPIPALSKLPPVSYQQEEANIALKQQELAEAERTIANQEEKIRQLRELLPETQPLKAIPANSQGKQNLSEMATNSIPLPKPEAEVHRENESSITATQSKGVETPVALIIEHEQAVLEQLATARDKAKLQLDIAKSQLITAKEQRAHAEYQRYLEETKRVIALQQQQIELERQRSIRAGQLQEREYSKAQIETKIQEVDNAIAQLSTVKAPYPGKIKKVKWTGQSDHNLTVTITLDVDNGSEQSTVTSEQ